MKREKLLPYFLVVPPILLILFIDFVPGVYAVFLSLFNIKYFSKGEFIGLTNYFEFFTDKLGINSLLLSIQFSMTLVILTFLLGLAFALVAQSLESKGRILIGILLIPWVTSKIISSLLVKWLLAPFPGGILHLFFSMIGRPALNFLSYPSSAYAVLVVVEIWEHVGFASIMLFAGLSAIPPELYEAAKVDGAHYFQRFFRIVLPLLVPSILVSLSMLTLFFFNEVTTIIALTAGGPINATTTLSYHVLKKGFEEYQTSYGNALSTVLFLISFAIILLWIRLFRKKNDEA